jgi:carboxylesterase
MNQPYIMPGAEPFYFPGNSTGCLMIHGFTGTPKEMRWMGEYLNKKGYSVLGIRLAGHATQLPDLIRTRWHDWVISVEEGFDILKMSCKNIFTVGLSMGGVLALLAADRYDIKGAIGMSTPFELSKDWRLKIAKQLSVIVPSVSKGKSDLQKKEAAKNHLDYPVYPTRSIAELNNLLKEMHSTLPRIKKPVLLMHSKSDGLSYKNSIKIHTIIGSQDKEIFLLEKSGHVITEDVERNEVFRKAEAFISRQNNF